MASAKVVCKQGCGKEFEQDGAWRVKHELKCKGPSGVSRIAARDAVARAATPASSAKKPAGAKREPRVTPPEELTDEELEAAKTTLLVKLRERRQRIDQAILAIEAVS